MDSSRDSPNPGSDPPIFSKSHDDIGALQGKSPALNTRSNIPVYRRAVLQGGSPALVTRPSPQVYHGADPKRGSSSLITRTKLPVYSSTVEKPLPSLPVASVKFDSPVRRSLIDCAERPLRRSVSPSDAGGLTEDWPVIHPTTLDEKDVAKGQQSTVRPTLGENVIEGVHKSNLSAAKTEGGTHYLSASGSFKSPQYLSPPLGGNNRPLASSRIPKPRESTIPSLTSRTASPVVRQTKTSTIRMQDAIHKRNLGSSEKKQDIPGDDIHEPAESHFAEILDEQDAGGHIHSDSRGRYKVTPRGSPYSIPTRLNSPEKIRPSYDETQQSIGWESSGYRRPVPDRSSFSATQKPRTSSLPLPTSANRKSPEFKNPAATMSKVSESHVDHTQNAPDVLKADAYDREKYSPAQSPLIKGSAADLAGADVPSRHFTQQGFPDTGPELLTVQEMLATSPPHGREISVFESDSSSDPSVDHDSNEGFRLRRIGKAAEGGPTLRIMNNASRILLGDDDDDDNQYNGRAKFDLRRKANNEDLRESAGLSDQTRRSTGLLQRPLSWARSINERQLTQAKAEGGEDGQNLIQSDFKPSSVQSTPSISQGDSTAKDFANFAVGSTSFSEAMKDSSPTAPDLTPIKIPRTRALPQAEAPESGAIIPADASLPARTTSCSTKPPPIVVSPPYPTESKESKESKEPNPSSTKKAFKSIRGLFHKKLIGTHFETGSSSSLRKMPSVLSLRGSSVVRRKKFTYSSKFPPVVSRPLETPFTAGLGASPILESVTPPKSSAAVIGSPITPSSLQSATTLTHHLLSRARVEESFTRKEHLIDLSKAMFQVINTAKDAEKAVELAKIQATKAEMSFLKVQEEVANVEDVVRKAVGEE